MLLLAVGAVSTSLLGVVPVELVDSTRVGETDEQSDEEKLKDVNDHPTEGDLQWTEVRVDREDVDQLQRAEDVGCREQAFRDQGRVVGVPLLTWCVSQFWLTFANLLLDLDEGFKGKHECIIK